MFKLRPRRRPEQNGVYVNVPHACKPPKLIFGLPMTDTKEVEGTVWQCSCSQSWKSVSDGMWNKWVKVRAV